MPQLDVTSFTSQILWLVAIYFTFYILLLKYILPKIGKILKFRKNYKMKKIMNANKTESKNLSKIISNQLSNMVEKNLHFFQKNNKNILDYFSSETNFSHSHEQNQNNFFRKHAESLYIKKQLLEEYEKNNK